MRKVLRAPGVKWVLQGRRAHSEHKARREKGEAKDLQGLLASEASRVHKARPGPQGLRDQQALQENPTSRGRTGL